MSNPRDAMLRTHTTLLFDKCWTWPSDMRNDHGTLTNYSIAESLQFCRESQQQNPVKCKLPLTNPIVLLSMTQKKTMRNSWWLCFVIFISKHTVRPIYVFILLICYRNILRRTNEERRLPRLAFSAVLAVVQNMFPPGVLFKNWSGIQKSSKKNEDVICLCVVDDFSNSNALLCICIFKSTVWDKG